MKGAIHGACRIPLLSETQLLSTTILAFAHPRCIFTPALSVPEGAPVRSVCVSWLKLLVCDTLIGNHKLTDYHFRERSASMKYIFKLFLAIQVGLYRISGGKLGGTLGAFKVLLLTTTGRKTGHAYTTPIGYFERPDSYIIVASNSGLPQHPVWYLNLKSSPQVTIQVLDRVIPVTAEILSGEPRAQAWQQVITTAPQYASYEKKTTRQIPVILLRPNKASI